LEELLKLWELGEQVMTMEWHGRGKKPKIGPFDAFFLLLYYYKQGHCAEALSQEFQTTWGSIHLSPASVHHCCDNKIYFCTHFGCLQVTRALDKAEAILHPVWQEHLVKFYSKAEQIERNWTCTNYSQVGIILDCTVQECNRPLARQSTYTPLYFLHKRKERDLSYK